MIDERLHERETKERSLETLSNEVATLIEPRVAA